MQAVTIKILYDNCKTDPSLQEGWGFSAFIKTPTHNILFDTGNDQAAFFSNAEKLGIDLQTVTDVFFSHKHSDHVTGCEAILTKIQPSVKVYLPKGFPKKMIPKHLAGQFLTGLTKIDDAIYSLVLKGGLFLYEQVLILDTTQGIVIITGCAHPGIVQIIQTAQRELNKPIHFVLGGFHLFRKNSTRINDIVSQFQVLNVQNAAPCHCSGALTVAQFEKAYQQHFHRVGTGSIFML